MKYELRRNDIVIYIGAKEDCEKIKSIVEGYHKHQVFRANPTSIKVYPHSEVGVEQEYIQDVLDGYHPYCVD